MRTLLLYCVALNFFGISAFAQTDCATDKKTNNESAADMKTETDSAIPCGTHQEPDFMTSWAGQPGVADHSESRSVSKGTHFACLAFAANGSSVPPACFLSFQNGGAYTLPPHNALRAPQDDVVTLSCNGQAPTCCKVQVTPDPKPLTRVDEDGLAQVKVKIMATESDENGQKPVTKTARIITSTTDSSGNQHPGSGAVGGPSPVTCTSASGSNPRQYPPSCNISAPGYNGPVAPGQTIGTSGAGTVTLTCNGQVPLRCTASIQ
jgi:hypothetical protein